MKDLLFRLADPALLVDAEGKISAANSALEGLLGYTARELLGKPVEMLVPRKARGRHAEHRAAFAHAPSARAIGSGRRLEAQPKDGAPVPVEISLTPLGAEQGHAVLVFIRGIAERLAMETRARLSDAVVAAAANAVMVTDALGRIVLVNEAFTRLTGWSADEVRHENPRFLESGAHPPELFRTMWAALTEGRVWSGELTNVRKNGTRFVAEQTITPLRSAEGTVTHFVSIMQDVTARHAATARTAQKLEQLQVLGEISRLGARATSVEAFALAAADLVRTRLRLSFCTIDVSSRELSGDVGPDRTERLLVFGGDTVGRLILRHPVPSTPPTSSRSSRPPGEAVTLEMPSAETAALLEAVAGQLASVLHTLETIESLRTRATIDPLTVLSNRGALVERGNIEVERALRYGRALSVILLDIDHFKQANDAHGHAFGDEVLRVVSDILVHQRRKSDLAARYGGDELVLLLPETQLAEAQALAERIRVAIRRHPWSIEGVHLTASLGVAQLTDPGTLAELLAAADAALYRSKSEGRDRVSITMPPLR
jgi:diguanylate cyclase (GGDEF)-like protein/PAS domain S-box-containing protein